MTLQGTYKYYIQHQDVDSKPLFSLHPVLQDCCQLEFSASLYGSSTYILYFYTLMLLSGASQGLYFVLSILSFKCWICQQSLLFSIF